MSFFVLKLVFAALVVGLLVIAALILRQMQRKRQGQAPAPQPAALPRESPPTTDGPLQRGSFLSKKKAVAEPEPEPEEAPILRRRQLATFAEDERSAAQAEAEALGLPIAERPRHASVELEPELEPGPEAPAVFAAEAPAPELAGADAADLSEPEAAAFDQFVMNRLEAAFDALQAEDISLDAYRDLVLAEQDAVERHIAHHQDTGDECELEAGLAARESVRWCLDWADERRGAQPG
jgi:hypothetical protein